MADIDICYVNQLYARLECERDVMMNVAEDLSFFVKGYKFQPKYKAGVWDGKIRMLKVDTGRIFKNLIIEVAKWGELNGYTVAVKEKEKFRPKVPHDSTWIENWEKYGQLEPMPHQVLGFNAALARNQSLILSPTSSGKSYIIYLLCRYLLEKTDTDILITVPSTLLVEQLYSDFQEYEVNWSTVDNVHQIYGGKEKVFDKRICISTWQSIYKEPEGFFRRFGSYFCDEAHGADAKSISGIIDKMPNAPIRVGLTGTLDGTVMHDLEMRGRFGPLFRTTSTKEMMDKGQAAYLTIVGHRLSYTAEERKAIKANKNYVAEVDYVVKHPKRNKYIVDLALKQEGNTLVLFNYVERHGHVLLKMLTEQAEAAGKKVFYIDGKIKTEDREKIRKLMETETNLILLASFGTMSTGVSIKNLDVVIFAHPYKARIKILQSIGRVLRIRDGKSTATLHDIGDDLCTTTGKGYENHLYKHFIERLQAYKDERFDYSVKVVDLL